MTQEQTAQPHIMESSTEESEEKALIGLPNSENVNLTTLVETTTAKVLVTTTTPEPETTLPHEIINNVHSNSFFDSLSKDIIDKTHESSDVLVMPKNITETYSSTEDLIAMETTTNTHKANQDNNKLVEKHTTEIDSKLLESTTINHVEIKTELPSTTDEITTVVLDTNENITNKLGESPKVSEETVSSKTEPNASNDVITRIKVPEREETTINAEILESATNVISFKNSEEDNNIIESTDDNKTILKKQYEVKETTHDITTTEKLFLIPKSTTELSVEDDLSIIPLHKESKNHGSYDQFRSSETSNDISDEHEKHNKLTETSINNYPKTDNNDVLTYLTETNNFTAVESTKVNSIKPVTEDFDLPKAMRCPVGQYQCLNGTAVKDGSYCIGISSRCDSLFDCSDGSDEVNCTQEGCPNNFR